jgi:Tfp pilus assembly protein PilX
MKTKLHPSRNESGSILMIALVMAGILGVSLISYLMLMNHQNRMVFRGQSWNHALALAEAGVEDGLAHLNRTFGTNNVRGNGVNGWSGPKWGPAILNSPRSLAGGSYTASISDGMPVITSTGRVVVANSSQIVERRVRVLTTTQPAFRVAMAARRGVDFKGNQVLVNSYDSGDPMHSTSDGRYDQVTAKAGGDIASTEGFLNVGNADVKGKLYTGPLNVDQYDLGPNGTVGDLNWTGPGIQPGYYYNDFNMNFSSVDVPFTSGLPLSNEGSTNWWQLGDGNYFHLNNVSLNPGKDIVVVGKAALYVTGNFEVKGKIVIAPGAELKLYVGGIQTKMFEVNTSGNAFSFQYYGLPSNKFITWNGNSEYVGTVYAPEAEFTLGGGGSSAYDYQGSCVVDKVIIKGNFEFHYDENLRRNGPKSGFVVTLWQEE